MSTVASGLPDRYRNATPIASGGMGDILRADDATHAGWIEFGRPHAGLPPWPEQALRHVWPQAGTLLLFPSFLFHRTLPYAGEGERISISFDLAAT